MTRHQFVIFVWANCLLLIGVGHAKADAVQDMRTVHDRIVDLMKLQPTDSKIKDIPHYLSKEKSDGSFADLNYADQSLNDEWQPSQQLKRIRSYACAYISEGNPYYQSDAVRKAAMTGIRYWLASDYKNKNWWWNEIGVPALLADVSLVFWQDYTPAERAKALEIIGRAKLGNTSANLVWLSEIVARRGVLEQDPATIRGAFEKIVSAIKLAPKQADGPQVDNSYLFHGPLLYSFGYGIDYLRDNAADAMLVAGTEFTFPADKMKLIRDWTLDGGQWFSRGVGADMGANGRGITRKDYDAKILVGIGENLSKLGIGREQEALDMAARAGGDPHAPPLVGNRQFWRADVMTHQRPAYYASARMYSTRVKNTEWGNGEALENFYVADGCNLLMKDGKEYLNIYPIWDWQRIPGTTVELIPNFGPVPGKEGDAAPGAFIPSRNGIVRKSPESFVGGVSDGMYGIFGGRFSRDALRINKSWFFFDREYACLGSGLSDSSGNPVITTLDQSFLRGPVSVGDEAASHTLPEGEHDETAVRWILNGTVGYLFEHPVHAEVDNHSQEGSWGLISTEYPLKPTITGMIFKAWIEHGVHPQDAGYAYTVLPDVNQNEFQNYIKAPSLRVTENTEDLQAVWESDLHRGGAIFYKAGAVEFRPGLKVSVDQPVMLMVAQSPSGLAISVSNPNNQPLTAQVGVIEDGKSVQTAFSLPEGDRAGCTITKTVSP